MRPLLTVPVAAVLLLSACGGNAEQPDADSSAQAASTSSAPKDLGTLKESGFGQADEYVWATAVVHNNSEYVGQTVTVSFNVLDESGELLATESQVESFVRPGADHIIGTQVSLEPGQKAAKVEVALDVEAEGTFSDQAFPEIPVSGLVVGDGDSPGYPKVNFVVDNPLDDALKDSRIQLACKDSKGTIIGGGSAYPELIPAGGKFKVDVHVVASGTPKSCDAFIGALDWQGTPAGGAPTSSDAAGSAGSAESAFKTWVEQFGERDWSAHYETLVKAQREVISEDEYIACRSSEAPPTISWVKALSVTDAGETSVPGTTMSLPATKVRAQVETDGFKVPVDAHMFLEDGAWKWSMTQENVDNCVG